MSRQSVVGRWRVGEGKQVLLVLWLVLGVCSLTVLGACMGHCWCLFLRMVGDMEGEERSRIRVIQMDSLRDLLGIRRMNKVPNAWIRQLCRVTKSADKKIDKGVLRWFGEWKMTGLVRGST